MAWRQQWRHQHQRVAHQQQRHQHRGALKKSKAWHINNNNINDAAWQQRNNQRGENRRAAGGGSGIHEINIENIIESVIGGGIKNQSSGENNGARYRARRAQRQTLSLPAPRICRAASRRIARHQLARQQQRSGEK